MKLMPFVTRGEPFLHADGRVELVPMQVFRHPISGETVLRIGRNLYFFTEKGYLNGCEAKVGDLGPEVIATYEEALHASRANIGRAPDEPYYDDEDIVPSGGEPLDSPVAFVREKGPAPARKIELTEDHFARLMAAERSGWPRKGPMQ